MSKNRTETVSTRERRAVFWGALRLLACTLVLIVESAEADIYKYVDKYGRVTLTDRPDKGGAMKLVKTWKGWTPRPIDTHGTRFVRDRERFSELIAEAAAKNKLPPELVHAVITAESTYNPDAVSRAGAVGLMQLMPETGARYGVTDRYDPTQNVHGGTRYLSDLMQMFKNNVVLAVAGYNAGENAVVQYGNKIPPYAETQEYVRRVVAYFKQYAETGVGRKKQKPAERSSSVSTHASSIRPITAPASGSASTAATTRTRTLVTGAGVRDTGTLADTKSDARRPVVNNTQVWPPPKKRVAIIKWADEEI